jgi:hypothetical protein
MDVGVRSSNDNYDPIGQVGWSHRVSRKIVDERWSPYLGPTQSPIQWVPGVLSPGVMRGRGVTLTTHPHLVPRLSMSRSYTSSPPMCHGM